MSSAIVKTRWPLEVQNGFPSSLALLKLIHSESVFSSNQCHMKASAEKITRTSSKFTIWPLERNKATSSLFQQSLFTKMTSVDEGDFIDCEEKVLVKSFTPNPHLDGMISDHLYHLALGTSTHNLREMFGDVKFICVGGTAKRMLAFACEVKDYLGIKLPTGVRLQNMTQDADRYSMYKVGSVLSVTHGMGISSLSILLHELIKLIKYAGCSDVTFLRIGTSGGLGLDPGTVVITEKAVDGLMRSYYEVAILGKIVKCPATFNLDVVDKLVDIGSKTFDHFKTVKGTTMCTSDFYEGQGRIDGAFCSFTEEDKLQFLRKVNSKGVVNIEMECVPFAAMCQSAGVKGAIICVTLLNRLHGDQITISPEQYSCFQRRPQLVAAEFIKQQLAQQ